MWKDFVFKSNNFVVVTPWIGSLFPDSVDAIKSVYGRYFPEYKCWVLPDFMEKDVDFADIQGSFKLEDVTNITQNIIEQKIGLSTLLRK